MKTTVITAPSIWASYLVNGDSSGITEQDKIDADRYLKDVDIVDVVRNDNGDCMDSGTRLCSRIDYELGTTRISGR